MWIYPDKTDRVAFDKATTEIEESFSDRAAAIVAATFVEQHLTSFLQSKLLKDEPIMKELFRVSGPLGSFGTKIDLCYLHRFYSKAAWKELDTIKEIRNSFAHKMDIDSFDCQRMNALSRNLTLWRTKIIRLKYEGRFTPETGFDNVKTISLTFGEGARESGEMLIKYIKTQEGHSEARVTFTNACKFYVAAFTILMSLKDGDQIPLL
jgi:hypothetical protein